MDVSRTKIHPFLRQVFLGGGSIYYCISPWIYTCTSILFGAAFWYIIYPCNRNRKLIVLYFFSDCGRRVACGPEDSLAPVYWPEISMATNTPLPAIPRRCQTPRPLLCTGMNAASLRWDPIPQSKRIRTLGEIRGRTCAALYLVYFDPPSILVRYPFCMWILIDDANLLWKYHIWTTRHGGCRSGARCIPYGWTDAGEANHREDGRWSGSWKHRYWFFHEPEFAFHGIGLKSLTDWNTAYDMCGMFFYLTGWIKSAPTYNYPCWIVVALIFTVQRCLICVIVIGSRNCVLSWYL